jgi:hypothetical protein
MGGKLQKRPKESVDGSYSAIPHRVLDSAAFTGASYTAKALLFEVIRQHSGSNNGRLQLTSSWLKTRGWVSRSVIQRAMEELISRNLIIRTKIGGLNMGAAQFAVTWLSITNFIGLDIAAKDYRKGGYALFGNLPFPKNTKPVPVSGSGNTAKRDSLAPLGGTALISTVPP